MTDTAAVGIVTYNRPWFAKPTIDAATKHLVPVVDRVIVRVDGPSDDASIRERYYKLSRAAKRNGIEMDTAYANQGVAKAKNWVFRKLLKETDADWIFMGEDDVYPLSVEACTGYIAACKASGMQHLAFAHHGPANTVGAMNVGPVTIHRHFVGAWCIYSRESLEVCGLLDERFHNSWEHVEHTLRLAKAGYTYWPENPLLRAADATGSEAWLQECPESIKYSAIARTQRHEDNKRKGFFYWKEKDPETWAVVFNEDGTYVQPSAEDTEAANQLMRELQYKWTPAPDGFADHTVGLLKEAFHLLPEPEVKAAGSDFAALAPKPILIGPDGEEVPHQ